MRTCVKDFLLLLTKTYGFENLTIPTEKSTLKVSKISFEITQIPSFPNLQMPDK